VWVTHEILLNGIYDAAQHVSKANQAK
jgi:hypothetical protein